MKTTQTKTHKYYSWINNTKSVWNLYITWLRVSSYFFAFKSRPKRSLSIALNFLPTHMRLPSCPPPLFMMVAAAARYLLCCVAPCREKKLRREDPKSECTAPRLYDFVCLQGNDGLVNKSTSVYHIYYMCNPCAVDRCSVALIY